MFLFHLGFLTATILAIFGLLDPIVFVGLFLLKAIPEYIFLKKVLSHLGRALYIKHFVALQALYSIYVLAFGVLANFGSFDWKGRNYSHDKSGV